MVDHFEGFDFLDFWDHSEYATQYVSDPVTAEVIALVESELGYKLPSSYLHFMKLQNGGIPLPNCYKVSESTSWSEDHVCLNGFFGIGKEKPYSLSGASGSSFWIEEWGYPAIGIYFANCPSAGHDMFCLDYRGKQGNQEPSIVHVDQELGYKITPVANSFEEFIRGLCREDLFADDEVQDIEDRVVSAWVDPDFAKEMGIECPEDGWLKKQNEMDDSEES